VILHINTYIYAAQLDFSESRSLKELHLSLFKLFECFAESVRDFVA